MAGTATGQHRRGAASVGLRPTAEEQLAAELRGGGTLPLLAFLPGLGGAIAAAPAAATWAAVHLGVVPSAIAYTLFAIALSRAPAPLVTSFLYLVPVVALLLSWWWLGEVPSSLTLAGGAVAVVGLLLVQRSKRRARPRAATA